MNVGADLLGEATAFPAENQKAPPMIQASGVQRARSPGQTARLGNGGWLLFLCKIPLDALL